MLVVEDFTKLPAGTRVPIDGPVIRCPRCGRNGVRRRRLDGTIRYVHIQTSEFHGDGLRSEPADCCTLSEEEDARSGVIGADPAPPPPEAPPAPES